MKNQQNRYFGFILASIFALIALWPVLNGLYPAPAWLVAAAAVFSIAILAPGLLAPFAKVWFALGHALGVINTGLLLAMMFFLVITPIGLVARMGGHDPLKLRRSRRLCYWQHRTDEWQPDSFNNQF